MYSILMLKLIGGPKAIINLPTNFGSVIVLSMFVSIIIPILVSSLHLAVNNFDMFSPKTSSKLTTCLITSALFLLSIFLFA